MIITQDSVTSMEESTDSPLPKRKALENNDDGTRKHKKTETANMLHKGQEESEECVDLRISKVEEAVKVQIEAINDIKETMGAQIKEWVTAIMQQINTVIQQQQVHQQQLDSLSTRVTELEKCPSATGLQASGVAPFKPIIKPPLLKPAIMNPAPPQQ